MVSTGFAGLPAIAGSGAVVDGGSSPRCGILLLAAIEQRLKIAERLAACIEDPRDPDRVLHGLTEMICYRALLIAAGYPYGNDWTRSNRSRLQDGGRAAAGKRRGLCSQPTISRPKPARRDALKRMRRRWWSCSATLEAVPRRILLDIDDTEDRVHGDQQRTGNAIRQRCFCRSTSTRRTGKPSPHRARQDAGRGRVARCCAMSGRTGPLAGGETGRGDSKAARRGGASASARHTGPGNRARARHPPRGRAPAARRRRRQGRRTVTDTPPKPEARAVHARARPAQGADRRHAPTPGRRTPREASARGQAENRARRTSCTSPPTAPAAARRPPTERL